MSAIEEIPVRTIDGNPATLGDYAGKVRLIVNVASKCGFTPQYAGLEALYRRYRERGFEVLGFPANDFGAQEPGSETEIQQFCRTRYDVTFPLFSKVVVKGPSRHPLYGLLIELQPQATNGANQARPPSDARATADVSWNFEKFLVDRSGQVVARFSPDVTPDSPTLIAAIERELS